jgi:hypothetical protein
MTVTTQNHPVWTLYDKLRTARLNVKYYGCRLQSLQRWNLGTEIFIAVSTSSSVAGFWLLQSPIGAAFWKVVGLVAAVAAICKPFLALTKKIKEMERTVTGYRLLDYELMEIKTLVEQQQRFDQQLQSKLNKASQQEKALISNSPEARPVKRVLRKCQEEVESELPIAIFYVPEDAPK